MGWPQAGWILTDAGHDLRVTSRSGARYSDVSRDARRGAGSEGVDARTDREIESAVGSTSGSDVCSTVRSRLVLRVLVAVAEPVPVHFRRAVAGVLPLQALPYRPPLSGGVIL